ncbi:hypothetical protein KOW79_002133 [Hemibagrus wyckioides]|uniref:Exonuclease domain-containing protein n=1 Tax=Hemibagrus wyckioides TaxID=337641 RepID=A0A9D3SQP0_9TELE|nr:hypothetical protein KOW79_002133 [Hemibagrus wyckioides]
MFPSAGLFSKTECPFLLWGGCERPYCPYKHHEEDSIGHGNPNAASRTFHNQEQSHTCLSELERINKQIEAVKNEVEKEQKRLSRYQSEQAEIAGASSEEYLVTRKTQPKDQNGNQLKCKKDSAAARKYVVDRTKPKTDLEYDPCSNFSADMRFSSSTDKIKSTSKADVDRDQQDKGKGKSVSTDPVPIPSCNLEDSDEEGELVIDIPPFENDGGKGSRIESSSASENANFMKTPRESSEMAHLDTDMPLLEKIKPANKGRASINEQEESHKSLYKETDSDYLLTTSSYPDITKDPGSCPSPSTSVETNWPFAHKVATEPVQNVPLYISGTNTTMVPSPHVELNPAAAPMELMGDQNLQKPAALLGTTDENMPADSSSSEELNYSDLDLSESDPMEECYRIFMEANKAEDPTVQGDMPEEVSKVSEAEKVKPGLAQKKRVAHIAKFEVSKSKAQVMVPLRDGGSQLTVPTRSQQCQKRAISLTAAVKGCQSFIAANAPKRALAPTVIHSPAMPNNYVNILPAGATMRIGPNLHLIVPEGTCALPVAIIPTAAPVIRPVLQPAQISQPMQSTQLVNYTPAKSIPTKRKAKGRAEVGLKVPHDVRQRYVNLFVEEFLKTSATVQDAFEKALAEEKTVFDRSVNKLKYLSIAVNALKRLKNQNAAPAKFSTERDAQASRGNVPLNTQALLQNGDTTLYDQLKEHILTKALLRENNYPHKLPDKPGFAIQYGDTKKGSTDVSRRLCCRCGTSFSVSQTGKHTRKEECNYHYGKVLENRVPGGVETRYSCCENAIGSPGCQVFKLHVHDAVSLQGFISSLPQTHQDCPGIYAIDTDVCYTTQGLELARVTVVNSNLQVVYDTFVKPTNEVIDYNTRFSGVSEDDVKNSSLSLQDVQTMLLSFISERTILVGHSLENDLCALKLIHNKVVDTSVVFPHRLGPPHKRDLRSLTAEYLRKIIQESVDGHDTQEDATACMELVLWKVKEDAKGKKWMPLQARSEASVRAGRTVFGHGRAPCQATAAPVRLGSCWTSCENVAQLADGHGSAAAVGNCNNGQTHTRTALGTVEGSQVSLFEPRVCTLACVRERPVSMINAWVTFSFDVIMQLQPLAWSERFAARRTAAHRAQGVRLCL